MNKRVAQLIVRGGSKASQQVMICEQQVYILQQSITKVKLRHFVLVPLNI